MSYRHLAHHCREIAPGCQRTCRRVLSPDTPNKIPDWRCTWRTTLLQGCRRLHNSTHHPFSRQNRQLTTGPTDAPSHHGLCHCDRHALPILPGFWGVKEPKKYQNQNVSHSGTRLLGSESCYSPIKVPLSIETCVYVH